LISFSGNATEKSQEMGGFKIKSMMLVRLGQKHRFERRPVTSGLPR
jgi:hypothetical protein